MQSNFDVALRQVLKSEGGFGNHPKDPGGMTNLGVTAQTWSEWVGHFPMEAEMRALTPEDVAPLYKKRFWDKVRGDDLPAGVDYVVFDIAVNSGTGRAAKMLQQIVGVTADGSIGPATINAVLTCNVSSEDLVNKLCDKRLDFWKSLSTFDTFGKGWTNRGNHVREEALKMVG
jgi:lysozyme family protein